MVSTVASELSRDRRRALRRNHSRVLSRSASPAAWIRTIAAARSAGSAEAEMMPLTPSSISSRAALSGSRTTMLGVPYTAASSTMIP